VEVGRAIVAAVTAGNFPSVACRQVGVSYSTLEKWLARAERGEQPYKDFAVAYERAELECESNLVEIWKSAAPDDWRAAKEFLAKRHPERWSNSAERAAVFGTDESGDGHLGSAFQINIHLTREEGGLPTTGSSRAIDVTPTPAVRSESSNPLQAREQPPQDRGNRSGTQMLPPPPSPSPPRPLTKAQEWNAEVRSRPAGYVIVPPKKKPNRDGSPGDSFLN